MTRYYRLDTRTSQFTLHEISDMAYEVAYASDYPLRLLRDRVSIGTRMFVDTMFLGRAENPASEPGLVFATVVSGTRSKKLAQIRELSATWPDARAAHDRVLWLLREPLGQAQPTRPSSKPTQGAERRTFWERLQNLFGEE